MTSKFKKLVLVCFVVMQSSGVIEAQTVTEGFAAYTEGDYQKAQEIWRAVAMTTADPVALFNLGILYENGQGVEKDLEKAREWYSKAASLDHAGSQLAVCDFFFRDGKLDEALIWCKLAAEQGVARAQAKVGDMYLRGEGAARDRDEAVSWYVRAGGNGHVGAQMWLGDWYSDQQDRKNALNWFAKAASTGAKDGEAKRDAIYAALFPPAQPGDQVSPVSATETPLEMDFFEVYGMGRATEVKLTRTYTNQANGTKLKVRIFVNDVKATALIDSMHTDPAAKANESKRAAIEEVQSGEMKRHDYMGYKGVARHASGRLQGVALKLGDKLIMEYELREGQGAGKGIEAYLPVTNYAVIIETLGVEVFEPTSFMTPKFYKMLQDFESRINEPLK